MEINYEQPKIEIRFVDTSTNCKVNDSIVCLAGVIVLSVLALLSITAYMSVNKFEMSHNKDK